jgi:uncharacterized protein YsxB (DUF464 family)
VTAIRFQPDKLKLSMAGHAGAARFGEDLICAGLSALWNTLERALSKDRETARRMRPQFTIGDGCRSAACKPLPEAEQDCALLMRAFADGMKQMAEDFPEFVGYIEG